MSHIFTIFFSEIHLITFRNLNMLFPENTAVWNLGKSTVISGFISGKRGGIEFLFFCSAHNKRINTSSVSQSYQKIIVNGRKRPQYDTQNCQSIEADEVGKRWRQRPRAWNPWHVLASSLLHLTSIEYLDVFDVIVLKPFSNLHA
jgi:hypothetical protein